MQRTVLVRNLLKKTPGKLVYKPPSDEIQASWSGKRDASIYLGFPTKKTKLI